MNKAIITAALILISTPVKANDSIKIGSTAELQEDYNALAIGMNTIADKPNQTALGFDFLEQATMPYCKNLDSEYECEYHRRAIANHLFRNLSRCKNKGDCSVTFDGRQLTITPKTGNENAICIGTACEDERD